jgi:hypothetical protein
VGGTTSTESIALIMALLNHMTDSEIKQEIAKLLREVSAYRGELLRREDVAAKQAKKAKEAANAWRVLRDWQFWLDYRDGKTYREIALAAGMSKGAVAQIVSRLDLLIGRWRDRYEVIDSNYLAATTH